QRNPPSVKCSYGGLRYADPPYRLGGFSSSVAGRCLSSGSGSSELWSAGHAKSIGPKPTLELWPSPTPGELPVLSCKPPLLHLRGEVLAAGIAGDNLSALLRGDLVRSDRPAVGALGRSATVSHRDTPCRRWSLDLPQRRI